MARIRALVEEMDAASDGDEWSDLNDRFRLERYRIAALPHVASVAASVLTMIEPYSRVAVSRLRTGGRPGRAPGDARGPRAA